MTAACAYSREASLRTSWSARAGAAPAVTGAPSRECSQTGAWADMKHAHVHGRGQVHRSADEGRRARVLAEQRGVTRCLRVHAVTRGPVSAPTPAGRPAHAMHKRKPSVYQGRVVPMGGAARRADIRTSAHQSSWTCSPCPSRAARAACGPCAASSPARARTGRPAGPAPAAARCRCGTRLHTQQPHRRWCAIYLRPHCRPALGDHSAMVVHASDAQVAIQGQCKR